MNTKSTNTQPHHIRLDADIDSAFRTKCGMVAYNRIFNELVRMWLGMPSELGRYVAPNDVAGLAARLEAVTRSLERLDELCRERHGKMDKFMPGEIQESEEIRFAQKTPHAEPESGDDKSGLASRQKQEPSRGKSSSEAKRHRRR